MRTIYGLLLLGVALSSPVIVSAQETRGEGEPIAFDLGYGIIVNEGSSIKRSWIVVNDPELPVSLTSYDGLETVYVDRDWQFRADYNVEVREPILAYEVRFIPFNIWGERGTTLSATEIKDFAAGKQRMDGVWNYLSESDAVQHYGSVAFIAQVRLADGSLQQADLDAVLDAARSFSEDLTPEDLEVEDPTER